MFAKTIVLSDAFLDMPLSARCLYFTLGMLADDDGFVNSPKSIMRQAGASIDDLNILLAKKFVLDFDSGVIVIKHWRINNYLRSDRYTETKYIEEKQQLEVGENGTYHFNIYNDGIPTGIPSIGKVSVVEDSVVEDNISPATPSKPSKHKYGEFNNVLLTDEEYIKLQEKFPHDYTERIENLSEGIARKGYKYKSHYLAILNWAKKDKPKKETSINPFLEMLQEENDYA
jgi:hypothetical protein